MPKATKEHQWLQRLVGEWTYEAESEGPAGEPPIRDAGTERVRSLGGVWTVGEARGDTAQGEEAESIQTLGYDPSRQKFVGTFVGGMMTTLWVYEGQLEGDVLVLEAEGPSYTEEGKTALYRDSIEFDGDDHRIMTSRQQVADGSWHPFMTMHYRRVR